DPADSRITATAMIAIATAASAAPRPITVEFRTAATCSNDLLLRRDPGFSRAGPEATLARGLLQCQFRTGGPDRAGHGRFERGGARRRRRSVAGRRAGRSPARTRVPSSPIPGAGLEPAMPF